jgi:hypothetical protein
MRADPLDPHDALLVGNGYHETVVVPFNVKNHPVSAQEIGRTEAVFDVLRRPPLSLLRNTNPSLQRLKASGVLFDIRIKELATD